MAELEELLIAVQEGHSIDAVREMIAEGVDINELHEQVGSPLLFAVARGRVEHATLLLELGADVTLQHGITSMTALHIAAGSGHRQLVKPLLEAGASCQARDRQGWTPLMFAAQEGHADIILDLLQAGSEVDAVDGQNRTALMQAARCGHVESAIALMNGGAEVNAVCEWATPLIMAATAGQSSMVEVLIGRGATIDLLDEKNGYSSLMMAAFGGHHETVQRLLKHGADVNLQTEWNVTAFTMAERGRHEDIVQLLREAGAEKPAPVLPPVFMPWGPVGDPMLCQQLAGLTK